MPFFTASRQNQAYRRRPVFAHLTTERHAQFQTEVVFSHHLKRAAPVDHRHTGPCRPLLIGRQLKLLFLEDQPGRDTGLLHTAWNRACECAGITMSLVSASKLRCGSAV